MKLPPNTPRLSQLTGGRRALDTCQRCGRFDHELDPKHKLSLWEECDANDVPEGIYLVLCTRCVNAEIEKHPRLYRGLFSNAPAPGAMEQCVKCSFRSDLQCLHSDLKKNGGTGLMITLGKTSVAFVDGIRRGKRMGWREVMYLTPPICKGREEEPAEDLPKFKRPKDEDLYE